MYLKLLFLVTNPCFQKDEPLREAPCSRHAINKVFAQELKIANGGWLISYGYKPEFLFLILPEKHDE
jgi:hypothetical protein